LNQQDLKVLLELAEKEIAEIDEVLIIVFGYTQAKNKDLSGNM